MMQGARRGRQGEDGASARHAATPLDAAAVSTMIGAMLIGLSATDAVYRDAGARGPDAPRQPDDPRERHPEQSEAAHAPKATFDGAPLHHGEAVPELRPATATDIPRGAELPADWREHAPNGPVADAPGVTSPPAARTESPSDLAGIPSPDAETGRASAPTPTAAESTADVGAILASSASSAQGMIGHTMAVLDAAVEQIAASIAEIEPPLAATIDATITGLSQLLGELPQAALGGPEPPAIPDPVFSDAFRPDLAETGMQSPATVDLAGVIEPLQLGFLGQSLMEGMDPHDGAFSMFGMHV